MSRATKELGKKARKAATRAGQVIATARRKVKRSVRRARIRRTVRHAAEAGVVAGATAVAAAVVEVTARAVRRRAIALSIGELGFVARLPVGHEAAIDRVTAALKGEGFGVLTRIDAHHTFREKLNLGFRPYTILGACNPQLAHRALSHRAEAGLLLPCNITVEAGSNGESLVTIGDPAALLKVGGLDRDPVLRQVAAEARTRLQRVAEGLLPIGR